MIAAACALALVSVSCSSALYTPGKLGEGKGLRYPLAPPAQTGTDKSYFKVEPDILLYHFDEGAGRPLLMVHGMATFPPDSSWPGLSPLGAAHKLVLVSPANLIRAPEQSRSLYAVVRASLPGGRTPEYDEWCKRFFDSMMRLTNSRTLSVIFSCTPVRAHTPGGARRRMSKVVLDAPGKGKHWPNSKPFAV